MLRTVVCKVLEIFLREKEKKSAKEVPAKLVFVASEIFPEISGCSKLMP